MLLFRGLADLAGRAVGAARGLGKIAAGQNPNGVFNLSNFLAQFFSGMGGMGAARESGASENRSDAVFNQIARDSMPRPQPPAPRNS